MNLLIIRILGFIIGFFLTLIIINYLNIQNKKIENFRINTTLHKNIEKFTTSQTNELIPYSKYKYMSINTYYDINKISNSEGRWYECDLIKSKNSSILNEYHYFTYDKTINLKPNNISEEGAFGADIYNIELTGPKCFYFANNVVNNELSEFSLILTMKINDIISKNNILFEMTGNTEIITTDDIATYTTSIININISVRDDGNFDFILNIGNNIYQGNINNIDRNIILHGDFLTIGFIYTNT